MNVTKLPANGQELADFVKASIALLECNEEDEKFIEDSKTFAEWGKWTLKDYFESTFMTMVFWRIPLCDYVSTSKELMAEIDKDDVMEKYKTIRPDWAFILENEKLHEENKRDEIKERCEFILYFFPENHLDPSEEYPEDDEEKKSVSFKELAKNAQNRLHVTLTEKEFNDLYVYYSKDSMKKMQKDFLTVVYSENQKLEDIFRDHLKSLGN